jgi:hypothetical protein
MSESVEKKEPVLFLSLAAAELPVFKELRNGRRVDFGADNDYPAYLQRLFDTSTKHGSIIKKKVTYIAGNGWAVKDGAEDPAAAAFIARVNRHGETLAGVAKKCITDLEIFGGYYLQVIYSNLTGRIAELYHLDYTRMRSNADNTQFYYKEDWKAGRRGIEKVYPAFNPKNPCGSQVYYAKEYRPGMQTYAMPGYTQGLNWINTDVEVGKHTYSNSRNGFTASTAITFLNGDPTDDEKRKATKAVEKTYSGDGGKKIIVNFVASADRKPIIEDLGASALTKEDFSQLDDLIQGNVFSAHEITTPALFGVATPGQLGQTTELRDGYEIFKNTYVNDKQQFVEEVVNRLAALAGIAAKLHIIPTSPLAMELSEATITGVMTKDEIREKAGLPKLAAAPGAQVQQDADGAPVNDHIKNLTGKQMQHLSRIVRQFSQGKINRAQAASLLKASFGMSDADIDVWLSAEEDEATPQQFSDEAALLLFAEYGTPRAGHRIVKSRKAKFSADSDVEVLEHAYLSFAGEAVTALQASILELISKDKLISPATLAQVLKVEVAEITSALTVLENNGAIKTTSQAGAEERTLTAPLKELQEGVKTKRIALQVRYSYEGPQDDRNRPFCAKLMELDRLYSRKDIEAISERLGYSVWDRRGGWYTVPGTNDRRPYCRHTWMSNVVIAE